MPDIAATKIELKLTRIISRAIAVFLLYWAFVSLVALPRDLIGLSHYTLPHGSEAVTSSTYWTMSYSIDILASLIRVVVLAFFALWFYRCGPRIQHFFCPEEAGGSGEVADQTPSN